MIYGITLGYVPSRIWEQSIRRYQETRHGGLDYRHIFLDQHYPLDEAENSRRNSAICAEYGVEYIDGLVNKGLHEGFNSVLQRLNLLPTDIVIGYDPDSYPETPGWDMALVTALLDPKVTWSSLMAPWLDEPMSVRPIIKRQINQIEAWVQQSPIMNSICAWRGDFLLKSRGLHENLHYYGTLEHRMWDYMLEHKYEWVFLPGWRENHSLHAQQDPEYRAWKWWYVHQKFTGDFAAYVKAGCPNF